MTYIRIKTLKISKSARCNSHPTSPQRANRAQTSKLQDVTKLILRWFENSLRPAYTDFHITQSILTDYNSCTGGSCGGGGNRGSIATVTKVIFPQYPRVGYSLHCLLLRCTSGAVVKSQAQPIGFGSPLPFPLRSPLSHRLFARHFSYLTANPENA